jgi:ribosomal protein S18 acetylase RimI-like enzyme
MNDPFLEAADENLAASFRHRVRFSKNAHLEERDGALFFTSGVPAAYGHLNGVLRTDLALAPEVLLARADAFFARLSREYVVWVRAHADVDLERALKRRGHAPLREPGTPCMLLARRPVSPASTCVDVRRVSTAKEAEAGLRVTAAAFDLATDAARCAFGSIESFQASGATGFVAYENDSPVGASVLVASRRAFGIYWVGTIPEARGRGIGAACTIAATEEAFAQGAALVLLQASAQGEPLYGKLGFETRSHYRLYRMTPAR